MARTVTFPELGNRTIKFPNDPSDKEIANKILPKLREQYGYQRETLETSYETPELLKAESIPRGKDIWQSIKAVPEIADTLATGLAGFFPTMAARMGRTVYGEIVGEKPEKTIEESKKLGVGVSEWVNEALHLGMAPEEPSEAAKPATELVHQLFQIPREWAAEPAGRAYEKLTGSKIGGALTKDATELFIYTILLPFLKVKGKRAVRAYRAKKPWRGPPEEGEALKAEEVRRAREAEVEEAFRETPEAREAREALETRTRHEDAEAIRLREHEARQKVYDDLFTDERVDEFVRDVEAFVERKAEGEAPEVTREEVEVLYNNWVERMKNRDLEFRKDWENWQAEKARLDAEGVKPAADPLRSLEFEIGREGRGLPPGYSDLKFGVETQRPYPIEEKPQPFLVLAKEELPLQRERLGYKHDYSIRRKMRPTGRRKAPSRKEYKDVTETQASDAEVQGTALAEMGERIFEDLEGRGIEFREIEGKTPVPEEYSPPATAADAKMSADQLAARERMFREALERKKRQEEEMQKSDELKRLEEEQRREMEEEAPEGPPEGETAELRAMRDMEEFLYEEREPTRDSAFYESLKEDTHRSVSEMLEDWKTLLLDDWKSERGSISFEKLSNKQQQAVKRLQKDIMTIKRNAVRTEKRVADYLVDAGFADRQTALYIEQGADEVVNNDRLETRIPSEGGDATAVTKVFEKAEKAERRPRPRLRERLQKIGQRAWAVDAGVRKVLQDDPSVKAGEALDAKVAHKGSSAKAQRYFNDVQKKVFSHLNRAERKALDRVVKARTKLSIFERRGEGARPQEEVGAKDYSAWLKDAKRETKLSEESWNKVEQAANDYFNVMRDLLRMKYDHGAIPDWLFRLLRENEYSPIRYQEAVEAAAIMYGRAGKLDVRRPPRSLEELQKQSKELVGKDEFDIKSSEIRRLGGGKKALERMNSEKLMASMIFETIDWTMKNEVTRSLGEWAEAVDNPYVKLGEIKKERVGKYGDVHRTYKEAPEGMKELHYFKNGEKRTLYAQDWFANQWANSGPEMSSTLAGIARTLSLSPVTRAFATGAGNPLFFLKGFPMDLLTVYMAALKRGADGKYYSVYSPRPPMFLGRIGKDIRDVAHDAFLRKGRYIEASDDGLMMNFLTEGGSARVRSVRARRGVEGKAATGIQGLNDLSAYMNRSAEILVRLAVRERLLKEGYSRRAATAAARDYLDFSQGGSVAKAIDNVIPYFNVAIQSIRTHLRSAKHAPKEFAEKAAWLAGLTASIYALARTRDPKAMDQSSDYIKNNYFLFPTGWKMKDDFGNEHRLSIKVRKEPATTLLTGATELTMSAAMGEETDFKRAWTFLREPVPRIGTSAIPSMAALIAYWTNTDPYTLQEIWKGGEVPPEFEWDREDTSVFWKHVGDATGMSPDRLKGGFEQIFGHDNIYAKAIGSAYDEIFKELDDSSESSMVSQFVLDNWGKDFLHVTSELGAHYDSLDKIDREETGKRVAQNQLIDDLAKAYYVDESIEFDKIQGFLAKQDRKDQKRLITRLENFVYTKKLSHRNVWRGIAAMDTPQAKARFIVNEWMKDADEKTREEIKKGLYYLKASPSSIVPKDTDSQFWKSFYREVAGVGEKRREAED